MAKSTRNLSIGGLILIVVALATAFLFWPSMSVAGPCIVGDCPSGTPYNTGGVWGMGADCSEADQDAETQALLKAADACGRLIQVCNFTFVETGACWWNSNKNMYQTDGYGLYNCAECEPFTP